MSLLPLAFLAVFSVAAMFAAFLLYNKLQIEKEKYLELYRGYHSDLKTLRKQNQTLKYENALMSDMLVIQKELTQNRQAVIDHCRQTIKNYKTIKTN